MLKQLLEKIKKREVVVGVMGLGYVGLPLVREFIRGGANVLGFDLDERKIKSLMAGKSYIEHIPSATVQEMLAGGRFSATSNPKQLAKADCILIAVPTPLNKMREPDLQYVEATANTISTIIRKGQLIVLESTTYPGTTRDVVLPILARSGLKVGRDFFLAFSPEREDPGRKDYSTKTIPKVVGGYDRDSLAAAKACYQIAIDRVVPVSSCEAAEAAKILENTYRCVNIALVNELKVLFDRMGIDIWEVINAAKTKPFGFTAFYPGPGLGGHCIPIDPFYLSWKAREYNMSTRFIELAGEVNCAMPEYVVHRTMEALNLRKKALNGSKVLVMGLAYKKDVDDDRESPSYHLIELLMARGAKVDYNDPHCHEIQMTREHAELAGIKSKKLSPAMIASYDVVIISTDHTKYDYDMIVKNAKLVMDTRNATANVKGSRKNIVKA
ncbi:MAG TPA: nucleotide sugar dehydrogenase [Phycisphaerae bacterium]|nr:nucleotide sugar dehydrogenase [Phycisphaerae bacterium]